MAFATNHEEELRIALEAFSTDNHDFMSAPWLKSDFYSPVWECDFCKTNVVRIDFRIILSDGSYLTSRKNETFLRTLKSWIIAHTTTNYETKKRRFCGPLRTYHLFCDVIQIIDLILLKGKALSIHLYGLSAITRSELKQILKSLASSNRRTKSIYAWETALAEFLKVKISKAPMDIEQIVKSCPWLSKEVPALEQRMTDMSEQEIILSRIWLWENGFYKAATEKRREEGHYKYALNTVALSKIIFADTLRGHTAKYQIEELMLVPLVKLAREMPAADVRKNNNRQLLEKKFPAFQQAFGSLTLLAEIGLPVPFDALGALQEKHFLDSISLEFVGRFVTLPTSVALYGLRKAIELILRDGRDILDRAAAYMKLDFEKTKRRRSDLRFSEWSIKRSLPVRENLSKLETGKSLAYQRIRNGEGLYELVVALYGAVIICVGFLMARRQEELMKLMPGKCWDKKTQGYYLNFENGKSGANGVREIISRPVPDVAIYGIRLLEDFQGQLMRIGVLKELVPIFSIPVLTSPGLRKIGASTFNSTLDHFCDFVEMPCNADGQRFYIRAHQQRRFFALLFFWGADGALDTLRWFLGHTDVEHVYRYITESTPGAILREAKVQYVQEKLQQEEGVFNQLAEILQRRFGTQNFSILDARDLDEYLEGLLVTGQMTVEPEFFITPSGVRHRIAVLVRGDVSNGG